VIVGIGVDIVDVQRWTAMSQRTPGLIDRTLTEAERVDAGGRPRTAESLAARFAVKEAVAKALGSPAGLAWHDCVVEQTESGQPTVRVLGSVARAVTQLGIDRWHVSISHDAALAIAYVVAESL
jgi:holo-[acyl-carrier protein] synthase